MLDYHPSLPGTLVLAAPRVTKVFAELSCLVVLLCASVINSFSLRMASMNKITMNMTVPRIVNIFVLRTDDQDCNG